MPLPTKPLPTRELTIDGQAFTVHGLSRAEAMHFTVGFREDTMPDVAIPDRVEAAELYLLEHGADVKAAEARTFRDTNDFPTVQDVLDAILELSGLGTAKDADPNTDGSAP